MAEFNVQLLSYYFTSNHGDAKNEEKCSISTTGHFHYKKAMICWVYASPRMQSLQVKIIGLQKGKRRDFKISPQTFT